MTDPNAVAASNLITLHGEKWFYKGEGNTYVVLAMPEKGIVLRIMKNDGSSDRIRTLETTKMLWMRIAYCDFICRLFFNEEDVDVPMPIFMSTKELCEIDRRILQDRPPNRTHKGLGLSGMVTVCPDHTTTVWPPLQINNGCQAPRVYCIEIKPKQGWMHEADRAGTRCAFCAHQYLKLSRGDVRGISLYCPLDLFSGRRERVERAIHALLQTPQNNLKMFRNGVLLDGNNLAQATNEALGESDRFCTFIAAALLGDFSYESTTTAAAASVSRLPNKEGDARQPCDFDAVPMLQQCVLHKVLMMQKTQTNSFATVLSEYKKQPPETRAQQQFDHVYRLLQSNRGNAIGVNLMDDYLVAATAQDCSVYVTFRQGTDSGILFDNNRYLISIKVSDLDPKPLSTIEKHRKRNADVLLACEQYSQSRK